MSTTTIPTAEDTLRAITPTLLNGRGCWSHDEIVAAVISNWKELRELRKDKARLDWLEGEGAGQLDYADRERIDAAMEASK